MLRYFLIDYSDKINYEQNKVTEDMIITKPDDFNFSNHSFDIKSLEKFCDDDAYQAIQQLFQVKFKVASKQKSKDQLILSPPKKIYNTRQKKRINN
jgi:hypothetical protein